MHVSNSIKKGFVSARAVPCIGFTHTVLIVA
jgi:hypothetical protein